MSDYDEEVAFREDADLERQLINLIARGELVEITPTFDFDSGYTILHSLRKRGVSVQDDESRVRRVINRLVREGILRPVLYDTTVACGKCGSHRLSIRAVCPYCGSIKFNRMSVLEHLRCGYSGPLSDFQESKSELVCPKCRRPLRAIGVDYIKTADIYKCDDCDGAFSLPELRLNCHNCGKENKIKDLKIIKVYKYVAVPKKVQLLRKDISLQEIAREITELGLKVEGPQAVIRGVSGIDHRFTFVVRSPDDRIPLAVIDVIPSEDVLRERDMLGFFTKSFDANVRNWIMAIIGKVDDSLREIARRYHIILIEAKSGKELITQLKTVLKDLLEEKARKRVGISADPNPR